LRLNRLRALIRRRVRYRVTLGGVLFLLALCLTGVGAFFSGNNLLFLIFATMMALLLVSGFLSRLVLAGLEIELLLPEHVSARAPAAARVRLRNLKRITPSFSIELAGQRDPVTNTPSILTAPVYFPLVPGRAMIEAPIQVVFPHRGRHRENLFVLSTKFPFGFLRKTTTVALRRETIVYPSLEPHDGMELLIDSIGGEIDSWFRGTSRDFYRIRPYEPRDSARHVDWKSTAHTGALQVREFTRDERRAIEIYFDRRIDPGRHQWFELQIERCAFLGWRLGELDARLIFRSQRFALAVPEEGQIYDMLRFLSLVEPIVVLKGADQPAEPPIDDSNLQIVFSAQPGDFQESGWTDASIAGPEPDPPIS
jgi:uncharacterized protein (DUF58 family)